MAFETHDSGKRVEFASGMRRDTQDDKTLWHLLFTGPMLQRWAELLTRGAVKYGERNWEQAAGQAELDRFIASAARHFCQWMSGDTDEDHAAAVMFNLNGAEYVRQRMASETTGDMAAFSAAQSEWSQATFGSDAERGPVGPAKHLAKEVLCELLDYSRDGADRLLSGMLAGAGIRDREEWADAIFLVLDGSRRAGISYDELLAECWRKLAVNKARQWSKSTDGQPVEHVRDKEQL